MLMSLVDILAMEFHIQMKSGRMRAVLYSGLMDRIVRGGIMRYITFVGRFERRCCNMVAFVYGHAIVRIDREGKGAKIEGNKIVHNGKCNKRASKWHPTHWRQNRCCHGKGGRRGGGGDRASLCYTIDLNGSG